MKYLLIVLAALASGMLFWFCKPTRYTTDKLPKEQIRFGRGGGIVGRETAYTLLKNGQLFGQNNDGSTQELASAEKKIAQGYFNTIRTLDLDLVTFSHPGNVYYFIEVPAAQGDQANRIVWGDAAHPVDGPIQDIYEKLMQLVPKKD